MQFSSHINISYYVKNLRFASFKPAANISLLYTVPDLTAELPTKSCTSSRFIGILSTKHRTPVLQPAYCFWHFFYYFLFSISLKYIITMCSVSFCNSTLSSKSDVLSCRYNDTAFLKLSKSDCLL